MNEDLVFYTNPMSRGRIVRWMLEEAGVPYRTEILGYGTSMKAADYLAINPMGKVPAIRHRGVVVTEAAAICCYLADMAPEAGLAPMSAAERADYYRWMFFSAGPLEAALTNRSMGVVVPEDQSRMVGYGSFEQAMTTLEHAVTRHPFIAGDRFTAADVYVGSHVGFGLRFGSLERRPAFVAYHERIGTRPALLRAQEIDDRLTADMQGQASAAG